MKIVRTEESTVTRSVTLEINEEVAAVINDNLSNAIVNGASFAPLSPEDIWDIMQNSIDAPRFNEEYFVEFDMYTGNMKLGNFVHVQINTLFENLPTVTENEVLEFYTDSFYP